MGVAIVASTALKIYTPPQDAALLCPSIKISRDGLFIKSGTLPFLSDANDKTGFRSGTYLIEATSLSNRDDYRAPVLVVPMIAGNSISVRLNGIALGSHGDPATGASSVWNSAHFFPVPPNSLQPSNRVEIEIKGLYEVGILKLPYITDAASHRGRLFALAFLTDYGPWTLLGIGIVSGIIMISLALVSAPRRWDQLLVGIGSIIAGLLFLDYTQIQYLPMSFLAFSKLIVALRHMYFSLFVFMILTLIDKRPGGFEYSFSGVQVLCALLIILFPADLPSLKRLYTFTYFTAIPLQPYLLYLILRYPRGNHNASIFLLGALIACITAMLDLYDMVAASSTPFISHYGFSILLFCTVVIIVRIIQVQYKALLTERRRAVAFREESMRDELTGAYNRKILPIIEEELLGIYAIIFVDLDDFKSVNDTFGHAAGDEVLKHLTATLQGQLRSGDFVVRTGGDEFVAVLPDCPIQMAAGLAEKFAAAASSARIPLAEGKSISYTASIGVAASTNGTGAAPRRKLSAVLGRADSQAYRAKRAGKNCVCVDMHGGDEGSAIPKSGISAEQRDHHPFVK